MTVHFAMYLLSVCVAAVSQLLLKKGATYINKKFLQQYLNPWVIGGYVLMMCSMLLTVMALKGMDFKNSPVIESLGYVMVLFLSALFFRERITKAKLIGTVCIILGIIVFYFN